MKTNDKEMQEDTQEVFSELKEAGKELLDEAADILKRKTAQFKNKSVKEYVTGNPLKGVLLALGAGMFLGFILKSKNK